MIRSEDEMQNLSQWRRELKWLRAELGQQHNVLIESMRDGETGLLEALFWFSEARRAARLGTVLLQSRRAGFQSISRGWAGT